MYYSHQQFKELSSSDLDQISGGELTGGELASWGGAAIRVGLTVTAVSGPIGAGIMALGATAVLVGAIAHSVETA